MQFQTLLQDFNPGKCVVYTCLFGFIVLLSLRLDGMITWSYWIVFAPLWFWKGVTILAAVIGSYSWWRRPPSRVDLESYIHYKAMLLSVALHLLLLLFELLACDKLESGRHMWILVFLPLLFLSIVSVAVCIWSVKYERPSEAELFAAVNLLQFIFLALRLDGYISWRWEVVFIPLWITLCLALVGVLYAVVLAAILLRAPEITGDQRRSSAQAALGYSFLVVPGLVSQVLLTNKLDGDVDISFFIVCTPILISMATMVFRSFNSRGGNLWWCGMQKDFCQFLLTIVPPLREYGNISYRRQSEDSSASDHEIPPLKRQTWVKKPDTKTVVPALIIDVPD
uniref:EOG090X087A n=1 Tax=Lynceus sp. MCZ IZ 141354 TaxID=1930659 RepID=A0A9N6WVW0_9CRUS|nr:EOG090X087A [Lynceus sp. MCZ IZ 141354]